MILHRQSGWKDSELAMAQIDRDAVVRLTRELIRYPSVNPPGDEREVAEFLGAQMEALGLEVQLQPLTERRANVVGRIRGEGDGHLILTGHLDVVPPGEQPWEHDPFGAEEVDGQIYGRGSADMKGGVAAMVSAAGALIRSGFRPKADLIIAATAGEEGGLVGAKQMLARDLLSGSRYLVVGEPSGLELFTGEKGVLWLEVQAFGRTAHGSMPWLGVNAVSYAARLIPRLEEYPFPFTESELLGRPTLSVNVIRGGNKTNVVPDACRFSIDMRTVPSQSHQSIIDGVERLALEVAAGFDEGLRVEVVVEQNAPPVETDPDDPLVEATLQTVQSVRGKPPRVGGVTYGTDAAVFSPGLRIPMVICGPGMPGMAHQPDEHVDIEQLVQAAEIYAGLARRLLS
jgi:succinyl-diaminopimelate desuccinylase